MYAYQKKVDRKKVLALIMAVVVIASLGIWTQWYLNRPDTIVPVMKETELVIKLPDKEERAIAPFQVEAQIALEYFDGSNHEVNDYTNLAGVYRPNQGIDYTFNGESFDVVAMMSGKVSEVKNDEMFGNSISVVTKDVTIVYQSLDAINFKVGDSINQNDVIGKASTNTYNPELGNHLHIVVSKNGVIMNPKFIIEKTIAEIK